MEHVTMIRGRFSGRQIAICYARPIKLHLGEFTGRRLWIARAALASTMALSAALSIGALYGIGTAAYAALNPPCQIVATDSTGNVFILGEGDDLNEAAENQADAPADWRELSFPHCYR